MPSLNGYLPASELVTVQGSGQNAIRLNLATAPIWRRMQADAAEDGVTLTLVSSYQGAAGYRSRSTQLDMRARPGLYDITPGIISGLPSGHGDGDCMDIDHGLAWVKQNGARYGVTFPLAFDHNHARYDGVTLAALDTTPIHLDLGDDMKIILHTTHAADGSGKVTGSMQYLVDSQTFEPLMTEEDRFTAHLMYGDYIAMDDAKVDFLVRMIAKNKASQNAAGPTAHEIAAEIVKAMPTKYVLTPA